MHRGILPGDDCPAQSLILHSCCEPSQAKLEAISGSTLSSALEHTLSCSLRWLACLCSRSLVVHESPARSLELQDTMRLPSQKTFTPENPAEPTEGQGLSRRWGRCRSDGWQVGCARGSALHAQRPGGHPGPPRGLPPPARPQDPGPARQPPECHCHGSLPQARGSSKGERAHHPNSIPAGGDAHRPPQSNPACGPVL